MRDRQDDLRMDCVKMFNIQCSIFNYAAASSNILIIYEAVSLNIEN
jgi:hypothetical protein